MLNAEKIKKRIIQGSGSVIFDGKEGFVHDSLILMSVNVNCTSIVFNNVSFQSQILFDQIEFQGVIVFNRCRIKDIQIKDCVFKGIGIEYCIDFYETKIQESLRVHNNMAHTGGVRIRHSKALYIDFYKCKFEMGELKLSDSNCESITLIDINAAELSITNAVVQNELRKPFSRIYLKNIVGDKLVISKVDYQQLTITQPEIKNKLLLGDCKFDTFRFSEPLVAFDLDCKDLSISSEFNCTLFSALNTSPNRMKSVFLKDCDLGKNARISSPGVGAIERFTLSGTRETSTVLEIEGISISNLHLEYDRIIKALRLTNVNVNVLEMKGLRNGGEIIFSSVIPFGSQPRWKIEHSLTGNWQLTDCNMNLLDEIIIVKSDLAGLRYTSVDWFKSKVLKSTNEPPGEKASLFKRLKRNLIEEVERNDSAVIKAENRREIYRMLKEAAENQKDRIGALQFQQEEMRAHEKFLKLTKTFFNADRIVLWASKSNDHGLNWWKPMAFAVGFTLLFFAMLVYNTDPEMLRKPFFSAAGQEQLWSHWGIIPQMMNPVHAFDKMFPGIKSIPDSSWLIDYIHRLLMAFFIVQTVSAFRKYMKG